MPASDPLVVPPPRNGAVGTMTAMNGEASSPDPPWASACRSVAHCLLAADEATGIYDVLVLHPQPVTDPAHWYRTLARSTSSSDLALVAVTLGSEPRHGVAAPARGLGHPTGAWLWGETHSHLAVWWLTTAWRLLDLAEVLGRIPRSQQMVAASLARPIVEATAAFWYQGRDLALRWAESKEAVAKDQRDVTWGWNQFRESTQAWLHGGRFTPGTDLAKAFGQFEVTNVLTQVQHLAKASGGALLEDYEWLCNAVHPSVGTRLPYLSPPLVHTTRTHSKFQVTRDWPSRNPDWGFEMVNVVDRSLAAVVPVLEAVAASSLAIIDDIYLTARIHETGAISPWRMHSPPARNEICPCGSRRKAKTCTHSWSSPPPPFPFTFDAL